MACSTPAAAAGNGYDLFMQFMQYSVGRKDQARESARARRAAEADLFKQLEVLLGLSSSKRQDKTTIIRLAMATVKAQKIVKQGVVVYSLYLQYILSYAVLPASPGSSGNGNIHVDQAAMVGIIMLVTKGMEVITVTENIYTMLGINMVDILGRNLCEFIHPCDHNILQSVFSNGADQQQELAVRMKNLLKDNGRMISMRQAEYKVSMHSTVYVKIM